MQYILSSEEYTGLMRAAEKNIKITNEELQFLCTKIACEMPVKFWGRSEATPWGCILDEESQMEYCDECPVQTICPKERKSWSQ